jgi:hypothetical protein
MGAYRFTEYFEKVLLKRAYLRREWCTRVLDAPIRSEPQAKNRFRFWGKVPELQGRYLRVVTLADKVTIHNAFLDRRFKP